MIQKMNDCIHCETCVNCGAKSDYNVVVCDKCGEVFSPTERVYLSVGEYTHLCEYCLHEATPHECAEQIAEED